jgi:hypothetical protein
MLPNRNKSSPMTKEDILREMIAYTQQLQSQAITKNSLFDPFNRDPPSFEEIATAFKVTRATLVKEASTIYSKR